MAQKTLVVVESPAKAKTINKYLGRNYEVFASMGHIIDLPKSRIAVDVENNFEPDYITVRGKGPILKQLKKSASNSKEVLLASDDDREGEAISWHLKNAILKSYPDMTIKRIRFHEITKDAIISSIKKPDEIDINKVNAQKARRVLDRLVGYNVSPFLWEKVKKGLSAGRVQSVALRLICDREEEIENFVEEEYWTIEAIFNKGKVKFRAKLHKFKNKKPDLPDEKTTMKIVNSLKNKTYTIKSISKKKKTKSPNAPFITSTMQQDAATKYGYPSSKTMQIAQGLYEGVDVGSETVGLITYMRTDSTRISDVAINGVREYIKKEFSEKFLHKSVRVYSKKKAAQDAHEAIRPTSVNRSPDKIKSYLTKDQYKLYSLIWSRFVASQMADAEFEQITLDIEAGDALFRRTGSTPVFEGFTKVYPVAFQDLGELSKLPSLKEGEELKLKDLKPEQHFTQPPPRYTDASIVKKLEEEGIGRPSTYAPTIQTLFKRYYITRKNKTFVATALGKLTNEVICKGFPEIVDLKFTAKMENELDKVEEEDKNWVKIVKEFYTDFEKQLAKAKTNVASMKNALDEETDIKCEKCGSPMIKKMGRYGYFLACSGYPKCKNAQPIPLGDCPKDDCDGQVVKKKGKKGKYFYGCSKYPDCDFVSFDTPTEQKCPKCGKLLFRNYSRKITTIYCTDEKCGYKEVKSKTEK